MTNKAVLTLLCLLVLGFAFFGALANYGLSPEDANALKALAKGASYGAGLGFVFFIILIFFAGGE